ncbi:MAG: hypothetical protein HYR91_08925 [Flavobacteriia bacterium]|nr:hypothetical protein [Flavobacteriia bacterium]
MSVFYRYKVFVLLILQFKFSILFLGIISCTRINDKRLSFDIPPNVVKVNKLFYYDKEKDEYLYDYLVMKNEFKLRKLSFDTILVDSCFLDIASFNYYGTFGVDKNNIYFLHGMSGEINITVEKKQKYEGVIFFENSHIRIINDTLKNFGFSCIEDSVNYDMSISINGHKVDLEKLKIIKTYPDYEGYCDFLIYDDKFYRHCCYVKNLSINYSHLKYYYEHKKCAKAIKFRME